MRTGNVLGTDNRNDFLKTGTGRKNEKPVNSGAADFSSQKIGHTVYLKTEDTLYSGGNGTGLSFYLKYAEESTKDNPIVVARGVEENGREFEQKIHLNGIDPRNATLVEMRALEAHHQVDRGLRLSSLPPGTGKMGGEDRADFIALFEDAITDMKTLKRNDLALVYMKYLQIYSDLGKNNRSEAAFFGQTRNTPFEEALSGLAEKDQIEDEYSGLTESSRSETDPSNKAEERETTSDIIVKPDGSRVLVVTNNIGGMQTTMSIEISKPTDFPANAPQTESQIGQAGIIPDEISASASSQ